MANRFTDTEKWKDEWFLKLEPMMKILWLYMCDTCDSAGVWKVNFHLASFSIGSILDKQSALKAMGDRIHVINCDKWFIPKFITYQYRGKLSPTNNAHKGALKLLDYHGLETRPYLDPSKGQETFGNDSLGSKDKDKDKDKDSSCISSSKNQAPASEEKRFTPDEVIDLWNSNMGAKFGYCPGLGGGTHRDNCLEAITFLPTAQHWSDLFAKASASKFLSGGNDNGWTVNCLWIVNYDNALKVLSDVYDDAKAMKNLFAEMTRAGESA